MPYESHLCKTSLWLLSWACCTGGSRLVVQTLVQYYPSTTSVTCLYPKSPTSPINHTWKRIKTKIWQRIQYCNILQVIWFIGNLSWIYKWNGQFIKCVMQATWYIYHIINYITLMYLWIARWLKKHILEKNLPFENRLNGTPSNQSQ